MTNKLDFEDFLDVHCEELYQVYMEEGMQYEYDYTYEQHEEDEYDEYVNDIGRWKGRV